MSKLTTTKKVLLASLIAGLLVGCDGKDNDSANTNETAPTVVESVSAPTSSSSTESNQADQTAQEAAKGNLWLDVFNNKTSIDAKILNGNSRLGNIMSFSNLSRMTSSAEKYMNTAENKGKFTLKKIRKKENTLDNFFIMTAFSPLGKVSSDELERYKKLGDSIKNMNPPMPEIDEAGIAYINSVIAMSKATDSLIDYYKTSEEYKLDDFKKAPELHKPMAEAYKQYEAAAEKARIAHNHLYEKLHAKELAALKAKGFDTMVAVYTSIDQVSDIFGGLVDDYNKSGNLKKTDKAPYEAKVALIDAALDEMKTAKESPATLIKEGIKGDDLNKYIEALNAFNISAKVALRDMGKNKDVNILKDLQSKQSRVTSNYNRLVR